MAGTSLGTDAAQLISETVAASAEPLTIVVLGPWTSIADAFAADPGLAHRIAGIHAMAGAIDAPGNISVEGITPEDGVEWNVGDTPMRSPPSSRRRCR